MARTYRTSLPHRQSARIHFIKRCRERYGIHLTEDQYQQIMSAIRHNPRSGRITAFFTRDLDSFTKLYQVNIDGISMYVIYNLKLNALTTSLSENPKEVRSYAIGTSIF
jgi:hypothetical protein